MSMSCKECPLSCGPGKPGPYLTIERRAGARFARPADEAAPLTPASSDESLVGACLLGDERAWALLVQRHRGLVHAVARRYGASATDAADIFQAVCIELVLALPRLRAEKGVSAWIATVAAHQAYRWKQRHLARATHEQDDVDVETATAVRAPHCAVEQAEQERLVREALAGLAPRCRRLLGLLFYQDPPVPYVAVAGQLGMASGSVRFIRARCLKRLKVALDRAAAVGSRTSHDCARRIFSLP